MPSFTYKALDAGGKNVSGSIDADGRSEAIEALVHTGIYVTEMDEAAARPGVVKAGYLHIAREHGLSARARAALFRQLATALKAGLPLLPALHVVVEQTENVRLRALLEDLARRVQSGESLSQALEAHPRQFSRLEASMARVGETAGLLDQVMGHLAEFAASEMDVREKVRSAAAYPLFVLALAIVSLVIIVTFILPQVLGTLGENTAVMPWPTRVLLGLTAVSRSYGWLVLPALVAGVWAMRRWVSRPEGRLAMDRWKLRIPVLGTTLRRIAVARFARTLGTLSKSGIQILEALHVLRDTLGNEALARQIDRVAASITQGQSLAEPLRQTGQFPPLLIQVIAMGERTGRMDELLLQTAEAYEKDTAAAIQRTMTILPAVFIVLLALVVLFVLAAVLLPIIGMETSIA